MTDIGTPVQFSVQSLGGEMPFVVKLSDTVCNRVFRPVYVHNSQHVGNDSR